MYGEGKVRLHVFLLSALNRSEMSTLYPGHSRLDRHHSPFGQCPNDITTYKNKFN
jgi:predicted Zn-dependent protease with MMP-like domain